MASLITFAGYCVLAVLALCVVFFVLALCGLALKTLDDVASQTFNRAGDWIGSLFKSKPKE